MEALKKIANCLRKSKKTQYCAAVLVAAGSSTRMEGVDKVMAPLAGEPLLFHTVRAFEACELIQEIIIVTRPELVEPIGCGCEARGFGKVRAVVPGGSSRQESVTRGLDAVIQKNGLVAIQDGARPLVTPALIKRVVRAAGTYGAAAPALPVKDTIKKTNGGFVTETPDRSALFAVQTPQVFDFDLLRGALVKAEAEKANVTDDCSAVERLGMSVKLVEGAEENFKVTTPWDLKVARAYLAEEEK